jgi:hypothetical protein
MADSKTRGPINGVDSETVATMVDHQITGQFDQHRMRNFWRRLLAGDNDPEVIADGLCRALSSGHYIQAPARHVTVNLAVQGSVDAEALVAEVRQALA